MNRKIWEPILWFAVSFLVFVIVYSHAYFKGYEDCIYEQHMYKKLFERPVVD